MATVFFESASELATLTNTFKVAGVATDPTTVSLIITTPSQASTTYTYAASQITKTSTGVYTKNITCNEDGTWTYEWVGTGPATDTDAGTWEVFPTSLGKLYVTVSSLKSAVGIPSTDTVDEFELHQACFAASRALEQHTRRLFYRSPSGTVRTLVPRKLHCLELPAFHDLVSVSALKTDDSGDGTFETTWSLTDYQLLADDGTPNIDAGPETKPYVKIEAVGSRTFPIPYQSLARRDRVEITGTWGWPSVPMSIKTAARLLAKDVFKSKDTIGGVAGFGEFGVVRLRQDPQLAFYANPYRRLPVLVR